MSEHGTQLAIARARSGLVPAPGAALVERPDVAMVRAILATLPDPELPVVTIDDLGMIERVEVDAAEIRVTILPTFVGCPAIDLIRATIDGSLSGFGHPVVVETAYHPPWTSARITEAGRAALAAAGIAPPVDPADMRCPFCASARVVIDSVFGPTQCRSLFYCRACRQPFEAMKPV